LGKASKGRIVALAAAAAAVLEPRDALAGGWEDATYGRVEGDLTLVVGAGGVAAPRGPRGEAELRLRYLESVGVYAAYEDGPFLASRAEPSRFVLAGAEVRPLFLFRWLKGHETSQAALDLVIDSIGLEFGAAFAQPSGGGLSSPGLEAGLGFEVPVLGRGTGLWVGLRGGLRWSEAAIVAGTVASADDRSVYVALTFAWHQVFAAHVADVGDEAPPR
jgi:hypothetical protein